MIEGEITQKILNEINLKVTPDYIKKKLKPLKKLEKECDGCRFTIRDCADSYARGIPTEDDTLKRTPEGFYGLASGCQVYSKIVVKAIALKGIQEVLKSNGIKSRMGYWDIDDFSRKYLVHQGVIRER